LSKRDKRAFAKDVPKLHKVPFGNVPEVEEKRPVWRFQILDFEGPFGWTRCASVDKLCEVVKKLGEREHMTWTQIESSQSQKSHFVDIDTLSKEARERLAEINQDDVDQVFSLRLSGKERVIGIRDRWILKILWWDPEHGVCPSVLKRT
jgi:hypothetical protein